MQGNIGMSARMMSRDTCTDQKTL
uniref:Ubiquitin fusion degradaton protein n=1 Tax=Rhizophora mucronata TaxID=61149 RepID=A0A2P2J5H9_RHIMU